MLSEGILQKKKKKNSNNNHSLQKGAKSRNTQAQHLAGACWIFPG